MQLQLQSQSQVAASCSDSPHPITRGDTQPPSVCPDHHWEVTATDVILAFLIKPANSLYQVPFSYRAFLLFPLTKHFPLPLRANSVVCPHDYQGNMPNQSK